MEHASSKKNKPGTADYVWLGVLPALLLVPLVWVFVSFSPRMLHRMDWDLCLKLYPALAFVWVVWTSFRGAAFSRTRESQGWIVAWVNWFSLLTVLNAVLAAAVFGVFAWLMPPAGTC